jgi:hypothetical protein
MKDLGELKFFLGIEVIRTPKGIWLLQRQYALDMLSKYGMVGCKPISVPLNQNGKLSADAGFRGCHYVQEDSGQSYLHDDHQAGLKLHIWVGEPVYASSSEATFGWCEAHTTLCECHNRLWSLL